MLEKGEDDTESKKLMIFGRNVAEIPCFRNSFLYGMGGGFGMGILTFLCTSKTRLATHVGFGSFCVGTMGYWFSCRYKWSQQRFNYNQLQSALRKQAIYEGTHMERELNDKLKDA